MKANSWNIAEAEGHQLLVAALLSNIQHIFGPSFSPN